MRRLDYKWLVGIAFVFGIFMDLLDTTIINVALPTLAEEFDTGLGAIEWVVTGYLLSIAIFVPAAGYFADRYGSKRIYLFALGLFTLASGLCGAAWNIESLIAFRVLQGVGGGMLVPVGSAMLFRAFPPEERASASAVLGIPIALAPTLGPIVGGALVEYASWRWIFWINIPIGIAGLIVAAAVLREHVEPEPGRFDIPGFVLSAAGFAALLYGLSVAAQRGQGFDSSRALLFLGLGLLLIVALVIVELRTREPLLDFRLLRDRGFAIGNLLALIVFAGLIGSLFLYPLFLQNPQLKALSPFESGLTTFPQALGVAFTFPIAARLFNRIGGKPLVIAGTLLITLSTLVFTRLDTDMSDWLIRANLVVQGIGMGMIFVSLQTLAFYTISGASMGRASSLFSANRQIASSFGVALFASVLSSRITANLPFDNFGVQDVLVRSFQETFWVATIVAAIGIVVGVLMRVPRPDPSATDAPASAAMH